MAAAKFSSAVSLTVGTSSADAKSVLGIMGLGATSGQHITVVAEGPTVLYELAARELYRCYKTDILAYVMVMQNINRELCRRLRRADDRIICSTR